MGILDWFKKKEDVSSDSQLASRDVVAVRNELDKFISRVPQKAKDSIEEVLKALLDLESDFKQYTSALSNKKSVEAWKMKLSGDLGTLGSCLNKFEAKAPEMSKDIRRILAPIFVSLGSELKVQVKVQKWFPK